VNEAKALRQWIEDLIEERARVRAESRVTSRQLRAIRVSLAEYGKYPESAKLRLDEIAKALEEPADGLPF
jgi:hypothetical protein